MDHHDESLAGLPEESSRPESPPDEGPRESIRSARTVLVTDEGSVGLRGPWRSRVLWAFALSAVAGISPAWSGPRYLLAVPLLTSAMAAACAIAPRASRSDQGGIVTWMPLGMVVVCLEVAVLAFLSSTLGINALGDRWGSWSLWAAAQVTIVGIALLRRGRLTFSRDEMPASIAGIIAFAVGLFVALTTHEGILARFTNGGSDFLRHLLIMRQVQDAGGLQYQGAGDGAYPRALHAMVAAVWGASGGRSLLDAWFAWQSVLWVLLICMLVAMVSMATRVASALGVGVFLSRVIGPFVVFAAFAQGSWVTKSFALGFATALLAGVCLAALSAAAATSSWFGSLQSIVLLVVTTAVLLNTWTLLAPVPFLALLISGIAWFRKGRRRPVDSVVLAMALLVTVASGLPVGLALLRLGSPQELASTTGTSGLAWPSLAWLGLAISAMGAAWLVRKFLKSWSMTWSLLTGALFLVWIVIFFVSGSGWSEPNYYSIKTLWMLSVLVLPAGVVGFLWALDRCFLWARNVESRSARLAIVAVALLASVLGGAAVLGRVTGSRSSLLATLSGAAGALPMQALAVDQLEKELVAQDVRGRAVLVWGIMPMATGNDVRSNAVRIFDRSTWEATSWLVNGGVRDMLQDKPPNAQGACAFLREHPDAIRVTGPNVVAGPDWLIASGCPAAVVRPRQWVLVEIPAGWLGPYLSTTDFRGTYPTYREFQQFLRDREERLAKRDLEAKNSA